MSITNCRIFCGSYSLSKKSLEKEFFKFESFGQAFSKACGVEGQRHSSPSADGETPCLSGVFTRGELKNSPVGCFLRGDALQEKASPYYLSSLFKSADLIGTKINIKVFLQAETAAYFAAVKKYFLRNNLYRFTDYHCLFHFAHFCSIGNNKDDVCKNPCRRT